MMTFNLSGKAAQLRFGISSTKAQVNELYTALYGIELDKE